MLAGGLGMYLKENCLASVYLRTTQARAGVARVVHGTEAQACGELQIKSSVSLPAFVCLGEMGDAMGAGIPHVSRQILSRVTLHDKPSTKGRAGADAGSGVRAQRM